MIFLLSSVLFSVLGAVALKNASMGMGNDTTPVSVAGYICYILSFALLDYAMSSLNIIAIFAIWAAGNAVLLLSIGKLLFDEKFDTVKIISASATIIGLVGLGVSNFV